MSQLKNKVRWCLKKAEKEIRSGTHRGLQIIEPNRELAKQNIIKAEHNLKAISYFNSGGFNDWALNGVFYTIYHCFLAILHAKGYESRNQECTIALIYLMIREDKISIDMDIVKSMQSTHINSENSILFLRETFQYGTQTEFDDDRLTNLFELCKKAIEESKQIIYG